VFGHEKKAIFLAVGVAAILSVAVTAIGLNNIAFADPPGEDGKKGGPKDEFNNGQCKQEFNDNICKKFHTGSD
jgi:hypothetical protein